MATNTETRNPVRIIVSRFAATFVFLLFLSAGVNEAVAQQNDTLEVVLPEVRVSATRGMQTDSSSPFSLLSIQRPDEVVDSSPGISLEQTLRGIPGLFMSFRNHFAVGERIVIRGMGSRAPFGVR